MPSVTIISGPTCCGKSDAAMKFARENDAEIISCDSVQIYRGMDIGSAKPSRADMELVRHHMIDVADVSERFDVARYVETAKRALDDIVARGKKVVVVGGSGFYLRAWFGPVADDLKIPPEIQVKCAQIEKTGGAFALTEELLKLDPKAADTVDIRNPRRTRKALERCTASGKTCAMLLAEFSKMPCPMGELERTLMLLDRPDAELSARITERTKNMIAGGLIEETKSLIEKGLLENPSASAAIGYRESIDFINSASSDIEALCANISANTMALVKKQRKFFRNNLVKS